MHKKCAQLMWDSFDVTYAVLLLHTHKYQPPGGVGGYMTPLIFVFQVSKRQFLCNKEKYQQQIPCVTNTIFVSQIWITLV